jgi:tetratricopeptide (TPR) repeat protein
MPLARSLPPPPSSPADVGVRERPGALAVGAIVLLGLLSYANALGGRFVFDDVAHIRNNAVIRDLSNFLPGRFAGVPNRYLAYLTFALNYRLGGVAPIGYHLVNVLVHVANALLVYALVRVTFRAPRLRASSLAPSSWAIAFVAAALFATHPLESQAVAYVVQRFTSLATTFYLGAVVLYATWRLGEGARPRGRGLLLGAAAVVSTVAAMKTKEIAFTLPLAVALWDAAFLEGSWRPRLVRLAPFLATLPVIPLASLSFLGGGGGLAARLAASTRIDSPLSRLDYATTQLVVVVKYLGLLVWPSGQNLDHDVPVARSLLEPRVAASAALLAALAGLAVWLWRRTARPGAPGTLDASARLVAFGIGWFFLTLLVESSFIPIADLMYEHRAYLPSVGLLVGIATAVAGLAQWISRADPARATAIAGVLLAVPLGVTTLARNPVWANDISLWSDAAIKSPGKVRPFANLGTALALAGRLELAVRALRKATVLDPSSTYARAQLAAALLQLGRDGEAEKELRDVLAATPSDPEVLFNLGQLLWRTGRRDEARPVFARFVEVAPPALADARRMAMARAAPPLTGAPPLR